MHSIQNRLQTYCSSLFNYTVLLLAVLASIHHVLTPKHIIDTNTVIESIDPFVFSADIDLHHEFVPGLKQIFLCAKYISLKSRQEVLWSVVVTRQSVKRFKGSFKGSYKNYMPVDGVFVIEGCLYPYVGMIRFKEYARIPINVNELKH